MLALIPVPEPQKCKRPETKACVQVASRLICRVLLAAHMACVSPTKGSVAATSGRENCASPFENASESHHSRGTTSTIIPMTVFQMSGAVPMPTEEEPAMPSCRATVYPSGKGHDHTVRSPTSSADGSLSLRKKLICRLFAPACNDEKRVM